MIMCFVDDDLLCLFMCVRACVCDDNDYYVLCLFMCVCVCVCAILSNDT
jgi:hypothetical protein